MRRISLVSVAALGIVVIALSLLALAAIFQTSNDVDSGTAARDGRHYLVMMVDASHGGRPRMLAVQ